MEEKINRFHTMSRKYIIDILDDFKNRNIKIHDQFNKIYKKNNGDFLKSFNEFENNFTVKSMIEKLNVDYPNWYIKKDILAEILIKIEGINLENFNSLNQLKDLILKGVDEAKIDDRIKYSTSDEIVIEICNAEKKKFCDFINYISEEELDNMMPIFHRKVLEECVVNGIKDRIKKLQHNTCLEEGAPVCFKWEDFEMEVEIDGLINILKQHGEKRIYEINTGGIATASYIMDLSAFNPSYIQGFDIYWCTEQLDWLIIKDHEGYFIIYGIWLINHLKCIWSDWEKYVIHFV